VLSARRQSEWAHRLVCPCLKRNEKLSALHYSDFRAGLMGIEYGYGVRGRPDSGLPSAKGRNSWQPVRVRNAHIRSVRVRSLRRSIAARSAKRWKIRRMWIASARIRCARVGRNTPRTRNHEKLRRGLSASARSTCSPVESPVALLAAKRPQQHRAKYQINYSVAVRSVYIFTSASRAILLDVCPWRNCRS
jgi:hypothetical protein